MRTLSEIMRTNVVTLHADTVIDVAKDIMEFSRIHHLPVVDQGRVIGIFSSHDVLTIAIRRCVEAPKPGCDWHRIPVSEIMQSEVISANDHTPLEVAVQLMLDKHIGCLPVLDASGRLAGLVTRTDLLRALASKA